MSASRSASSTRCSPESTKDTPMFAATLTRCLRSSNGARSASCSNLPIAIGKLLQEALRAPFELRKHRVRVAANIGVSFVDSGLQRVEDALREADIALSVAKASGKIRVVAYNPAM